MLSANDVHCIQMHFKLLYHGDNQSGTRSDCSLGSSLILVHNACNIGNQSTSADEQAEDKCYKLWENRIHTAFEIGGISAPLPLYYGP